MEIVLNDLYDYPKLKIYQYVSGFKFSLDSILLAEFTRTTRKAKKILDLCTGNAAVPLILSSKTNALIDAFEIQKSICDLADMSIKYNNKENQIKVYNASVTEIDNLLKGVKYDIITCNPPYFKVDSQSHLSLTKEQAIARHEISVNLEQIFQISANHLDDSGELFLVHRVNRLDEIIIYANKYNINVKEIELIKTKAEAKPYIVLVRCVKNSKFGVKINNIKNINNLKTYQNMFKEDL